MNSSNIKDALYVTEQAREAWLSNLSFDKNVLKAVSIGLNGFLRDMEEIEILKNSIDPADKGFIKMFIADAELYGENDKLTLKTNFTTTQRIFDKVITKLKSEH